MKLWSGSDVKVFLCRTTFKFNPIRVNKNTWSWLQCAADQQMSYIFICPNILGGFYQDSVAAVGLTLDGNGCRRCPAGTFVHPKNAPGKASWDCKACPEG